MTLKEAQCLQERFYTTNKNIICTHRGPADPLLSERGEDVGFLVCLTCGQVYISRYQPLSTDQMEALENLEAKSG